EAIEFPEYRGEALAYLSSTTRGERPPCIIRLHTPCVVLGRYNRARDSHPVLEAFEMDAVRMADRLVSPARAPARDVDRLCPGLSKIDILANPADPEFLAIDPERERARLGIDDRTAGENGNEILYVGRLEERKGVETLILAAPEILDRCPGAVIRLVG